MWLGFDLCLSSGSVRRLRGAGRVGSGVHGVVHPRRVRGGACGPAVGRWPHWESHSLGGVDGRAGGVRSVQVGQQRAHVQGVGVPDGDLTEDRGVGGK